MRSVSERCAMPEGFRGWIVGSPNVRPTQVAAAGIRVLTPWREHLLYGPTYVDEFEMSDWWVDDDGPACIYRYSRTRRLDDA